MSDWKEYKLGELATFYNGRAYKNGEFKTSGTPIVRIQNLTGEGKTVYSDLQLDENKYIENGDLIYAWSATFGPYIWRGKKSIYHYHIWKIVCNKEIIDKFYFYYKLKLISDSLKDNGNGSIFVHITKSFMENFKIKIPSLEKQKYISNILSNLDKKIIFNTQINQTLEQIAQTLFKSWFVDFDPVHAKVQALSDGMSLEQAELAAMQAISGKTAEELTALSQTQPDRYAKLVETAKAFPCEIVEVEGVEVPKGWKTIPFKDFIKDKKEKVGSLKNIPEYSVTNNGIIPRSQKFNKQLSKNPEKNKLLHKTDLVFGMSREILNWGIMVDDIGSVSSAYHVYSIDKNVINHLYLKMMMMNKFQYFNELIRPSSREGQSFDKELLKEKTVIVPSNFLLDHFLYKLELLNHQINTIKKETKTLISIRDTLLPELLNGKI